MKKYYVVMSNDGFYKAKDKKDALRELAENDNADRVILSQSKTDNYHHDRVHIVAFKSKGEQI